MVLVVVVVAALLAIPGVPGHAQSALLGELAVSDSAAAAAKIDPFASQQAPRSCADLESTYELGNHLFKNSQLGFYASVWPSYQALEALELRSLSPGESGCLQDLVTNLRSIDDNYWDRSLAGLPAAYDQGPRALHQPSDFPRVDDSFWMGLALMSAYARTRDPGFLAKAEGVFTLAQSNWDRRRGGIYWEQHAPGAPDNDKAVVSNGPVVMLGVELYRATGRREYLDWAERIFSWLRANLVDRSSGLYNDHVDDNVRPEKVGTAKYTYNQGTMVAAMAMLSTVDPAAYPLSQAVELAERSMAYFGAHHSYGQPGFDAVWAVDVLWVASLDHDAAFLAAAQRSVRSAAAAAPRQPGDLLAVSSRLTLEALTRLPPDQYHRLIPW